MASIRDLINDDQEMEPPSHHTFASNSHPESSPSSHSRSHSHGHHSHSHHHHSQHNHHFQPYPSHHSHGNHSHHPQELRQQPQHYPPHPQCYPREYYNQCHAPPPPHPEPQYYQPSPYSSRDEPPTAFDPVKAEIAQHHQQPQFHQHHQPYRNHQHRDTNPHMPPDESSPIVRIKIIQQPLHARMCGFGEKDRRPVDPPPIVQLFFSEAMASLPPKVATKKRGSGGGRGRRRKLKAAKNKDHSHARSNSHDADKESHNGDEEEEDESYQLDDDDEDPYTSGARDMKQQEPEDHSEHKVKPAGSPNDSEEDDLDDDDEDGEEEEEQDPLFVLHVSLWSHDGTEVRNMIATPGQSDPPKLTRILMGSLVVSPILLNNPEGVPGWYFSFPDLSIRTEGVYTLKFSLMRFGSFDFLSGEDGQQVSTLVAEEMSEPFTVFSAKKFPGMTESTELSKAFAKQGLKIPIRNDLRVRKNADKD
ncbi:hypothetical protein BG006_004190 [Podila minutissima]|uniref:Velvet domain-containing protein n=1 Tax=Podila minutissima TaxID=64525 RepID=A0A9P5SNY7_9FUNG|nr:hypothetical protein BG006_004190 [Podila minutissima]